MSGSGPARMGFDLAQLCPRAHGYSMLAKSAASEQRPAMIKDLVVNLSARNGADPASDYAISVADAFRAHAFGIAFAYEPILPPSVMGGLPPDIIEAQRAEGEDAANTILSYAADAGADFIVMGGYGHSRLREFILGGATRGILSAMTVPTLMSH